MSLRYQIVYILTIKWTFSEAARCAPEMERRKKKGGEGKRDEGVYFSAVLEDALISS